MDDLQGKSRPTSHRKIQQLSSDSTVGGGKFLGSRRKSDSLSMPMRARRGERQSRSVWRAITMPLARKRCTGITVSYKPGWEDATCFVAFAYSYPTQSDAIDVGRGFTSDDGVGLNGEGYGLLGPDSEGEIHVEIIADGHPQLFRFDK